jgi:hypothetical protein
MTLTLFSIIIFLLVLIILIPNQEKTNNFANFLDTGSSQNLQHIDLVDHEGGCYTTTVNFDGKLDTNVLVSTGTSALYSATIPTGNNTKRIGPGNNKMTDLYSGPVTFGNVSGTFKYYVGTSDSTIPSSLGLLDGYYQGNENDMGFINQSSIHTLAFDCISSTPKLYFNQVPDYFSGRKISAIGNLKSQTKIDYSNLPGSGTGGKYALAIRSDDFSEMLMIIDIGSYFCKSSVHSMRLDHQILSLEVGTITVPIDKIKHIPAQNDDNDVFYAGKSMFEGSYVVLYITNRKFVYY